MTIIESIRNYIMQYPNLKEFDNILDIYVDYSKDSEATTYTIEEGVTDNPIKKRYTDGSTIREFLFVFLSVEFYGSEAQQNIDNLGFFEEFSQWLEYNTDNGILPIMAEGKEARSIEALTNGYLFNNATNGETARYQIQCKLKYLQK